MVYSWEPEVLYHYRAFGLDIQSEIACPYLLPGDDAHQDLLICFDSVPQELEQIQERGSNYQIGAGRLLLTIERVARYLVIDGCEIRIEPYPGVDDNDLRLFLLGSAMGALLHQRGIWPLHGSSVATGRSGAAGDRGAAIFLGPSGSGKSTLTGALHQRGFQAISDDVCAIMIDPGRNVQVWPAYPRISLWADSVVRLGSQPAQLQQTHTAQEKYDFPVQRFSRDPATVTAVYILSASDQRSPCLTPLKGFDKIRELTANTYRLHFLTGMGLEQQHFQQAQALARQARLLRVTYPRQLFLLDELADLIEKDMLQ